MRRGEQASEDRGLSQASGNGAARLLGRPVTPLLHALTESREPSLYLKTLRISKECAC